MIRDLVEGKRVALVGRAGSILGSGNGKAIDSADVVVRINTILPIPVDQIADVGSRTDILYHCRRARTAARTAKELGLRTHRVLGERRKRIAKRFFKKPRAFRPTTGFTAAVDLLDAGAEEVRLYAFDVFLSGHFQDREPEGDDYTRPLRWSHNPEEERVAWRRLFKNNKRMIPDAILREAIK